MSPCTVTRRNSPPRKHASSALTWDGRRTSDRSFMRPARLGRPVRIGVIGAGRMGRPIINRLVAAGYEPTVLTRRPTARAAAEAAGLKCADTVRETVQDAQVVVTVVFDDEQL